MLLFHTFHWALLVLPINLKSRCHCRTQTLHFSFLNADKHRHWMPSLLRSASDVAQNEGHSDEDEESSDYSGFVLALNGYKKYFCLFRPVFTGDDPGDASSTSETSFSSDSRRKSRSRSRSSSHSRSRSHSREDGAAPKRGSSRATSIEVHHKLDRLGLWMERLMEGTLPRLQVPVWPSLGEAANGSSTESWGQSKNGVWIEAFTLYVLASWLSSLASKLQTCCRFLRITLVLFGAGRFLHWTFCSLFTDYFVC